MTDRRASLRGGGTVKSYFSFVCVECGESFLNEDALKVHNNAIHSGRRVQCDSCGAGFRTKATFLEHICQKPFANATIATVAVAAGSSATTTRAVKQEKENPVPILVKAKSPVSSPEKPEKEPEKIPTKPLSSKVVNHESFTYLDKKDPENPIERTLVTCTLCKVTYLSVEAFERHLPYHSDKPQQPVKIEKEEDDDDDDDEAKKNGSIREQIQSKQPVKIEKEEDEDDDDDEASRNGSIREQIQSKQPSVYLMSQFLDEVKQPLQ